MNGSDDSFFDPSASAEDAAGRGPARAAPRASLFLLTAVSLSGGRTTTRARVRNLSATGLMADCEKPVGQGQRVSLSLRGIGEVEGVIAWSEDNRIGIAFDTPIDPSLTFKPVGQASVDLPDYLRTWTGTTRR